jgi:hypothetical protein
VLIIQSRSDSGAGSDELMVRELNLNNGEQVTEDIIRGGIYSDDPGIRSGTTCNVERNRRQASNGVTRQGYEVELRTNISKYYRLVCLYLVDEIWIFGVVGDNFSPYLVRNPPIAYAPTTVGARPFDSHEGANGRVTGGDKPQTTVSQYCNWRKLKDVRSETRQNR